MEIDGSSETWPCDGNIELERESESTGFSLLEVKDGVSFSPRDAPDSAELETIALLDGLAE